MDNSQIAIICIIGIIVCLAIIYLKVKNVSRLVELNRQTWLSYETDKVKSELRQSGNQNLPQMQNPPEPPDLPPVTKPFPHFRDGYPPDTKMVTIPGALTADEATRMAKKLASLNIDDIKKMHPGTVESDISEADKLTIERHFDSMRDGLMRSFENEINNEIRRNGARQMWTSPTKYQKGKGGFLWHEEWGYKIITTGFILDPKTITDAAAAVGNYGQNDLPNVTNWKSDKA